MILARRGAGLALLMGVLLLSGCGTLGLGARASDGQRLDPWENWNRKVFDFNEAVDVAVFKPVATAYRDVIPRPVRVSVDNFFSNANDAWSAVNHALQGRLEPTVMMTMRFLTNSVFGVAGLFDPASEIGFERNSEDFGTTLGRWGLGAGAYIVLPLLGPSSVRDTIALPFDRLATPAVLINGGREQAMLTTLQFVNARSNFLGASKLLDEIALDKYSFVRDAYLARRRSLVAPDDDDTVPDQSSKPMPRLFRR